MKILQTITLDKQKLLHFLNTVGTPRVLRLLKGDNLTVLSLHRISPERDYFFNPITPRHFESLLQYVSKHYTVISFSDIRPLLHANAKPAKPYLILSFDDGYYDFIEHALPLLDKYNLPSNHNVVNACANSNEIIWTQRQNTIFNHCRDNNLNLSFQLSPDTTFSLKQFEGNWMSFYLAVFKQLLDTAREERMAALVTKEQEFGIGSTYRMMNWDDIRECMRHRVEIGSHTYHHDVLSTIKDLETLKFEILQSKVEIETNIHRPVNVLSLPNGQMNPAVNQICRTAAFSHVLFVEDRLNDWNKDLLDLETPIHRIMLVDESPAEMFLRTELFHSKLRRYV
jgi:peptidoglycan/xylan/chitin deacetylase (PgdA/CDA1 family)